MHTHLPTKHLPLEFLPKHTSVWILLWAPTVMGFCTFSCWKCLCSTLPLERNIMEALLYVVSQLYHLRSLKINIFLILFSFEILMTHLFVNSCHILPDKSHLSYMEPLFHINFLNIAEWECLMQSRSAPHNSSRLCWLFQSTPAKQRRPMNISLAAVVWLVNKNILICVLNHVI